MAEGFYRFCEWVVPPVVAMNGTTFTFRGMENIPARGGALLAQNHTSYLDWLPTLFAVRERHRRAYFMIKAEMADVKAVNYVINHARLIPVDRTNGQDAFDLAVRRLREGELIGMHPEATISRSFELQGVQDRRSAAGAGRAGADNSDCRLGRPSNLAQRSSKEGVPQQGSGHRGRRPAVGAAGHPRAAQRHAAQCDDGVAVPGAGGVSASRGGVLGTAAAGWQRAEPGRLAGRSDWPNCRSGPASTATTA